MRFRGEAVDIVGVASQQEVGLIAGAERELVIDHERQTAEHLHFTGVDIVEKCTQTFNQRWVVSHELILSQPLR